MKKIITIITLLLNFLSQTPAMGMEFTPDKPKPAQKGILPDVDLTDIPPETSRPVHFMYCTNPGCTFKVATETELREHLKECPLDPKSFDKLKGIAAERARTDTKPWGIIASQPHNLYETQEQKKDRYCEPLASLARQKGPYHPIRHRQFTDYTYPGYTFKATLDPKSFEKPKELTKEKVWTNAELRETIASQPYNLDEEQEKEKEIYYELLTSLESQEKPFHCPCSHNDPPCQYQQVHKNDIRKHLLQGHTSYRPYWCPLCKERSILKNFSQWKLIRSHMRHRHEKNIGKLERHTLSDIFHRMAPIRLKRGRPQKKRK